MQLITILFSIKNFRVIVLTLSISYLNLRKNLKTEIISTEFQLTDSLYYTFTQISHAIPKKWKQIIRENIAETCATKLDHRLLLSLKELTSKQLYSIVIFKKYSMPTSQQYFNFFSPQIQVQTGKCLLPRKISRSTSVRAFRYKMLSYVLYLNKMLLHFGKSLIHLFNQVVSLWIEIKLFIQLTLFTFTDCRFRSCKR